MEMQSLKNYFYKSKYTSIKWGKYFNIYEKIFKKYKNKKIVFVEIGIFQGGSLEIWKKFFGKKAKIIGIDLNPNCKKFKDKKRNIDVFIGDQSDENFWRKFFKKVGKVDVILDDGGHSNKQQILTILNTVKNIKDNGKLVIEDTHTSYLNKFGNPNKYSFINFSKLIIDQINYSFPFKKQKKFKYSVSEYIYGISFYESLVEFKINRKNCYRNILLNNFKKNSGLEDFRHKKSKMINLMLKFKNKTGLFKRVKLQKLNYLIENLRLKKYFQ